MKKHTIRKSLALVLALVLLMSLGLTACGGGENTNKVDLKVGAILIGDETEGYTLAHMNGMDAAAKVLKAEGKTVEVQYKKVIPETDAVATNALDLIADGCTMVVSNSYGHQFHYGDIIKENPSVQFVAMTGDQAASSGLPNFANAFTRIYESRYVSGVAAGLKLKEMVDNGDLTAEKVPNSFDADGNIKIGYVGAFNYAEVVSGYTAFYLGIKSVVPNVSMTVKYTNSWFSEEREAAVAEFLMGAGCVIIGQHADSTGAPAAVQKAYNADNSTLTRSIGYNVSMLGDAPDVAITSATNNWEVYYEYLFRAMLNGDKITTDWAEGYAKNAVGVTELGKTAAAGTDAKLKEAADAIKNGTLKVFDCANFTVDGKHLTTYTGAYGMNNAECIKTEGGVTYFDESSLRSAPYFDIRIDGITELKSEYED